MIILINLSKIIVENKMLKKYFSISCFSVKQKFIALYIMIFLLAFNQLQAVVLRVGVAKTDITPTESLYLSGYSIRTEPSKGAYGKIYLTAFAVDDGARRIVFIESDLIGYPSSDSLRQIVSAASDLPLENIILGSAHNHSSPILGRRNSNSIWSKEFSSKLVSTVMKAINDLEPVTLGGGIGHSYIAMNRRKVMEETDSYITFDENYISQSYGEQKTDHPVLVHEIGGVVRLGANPKGSIDDEVGILRIDRKSGAPKAVFINYAAHGTSLGGRNLMISPEWCGHMVEYVEKQIPGVVAMFAQGAAGDINPRRVGGLDGFKDDLEKTKELGYEIGKEVIRVFNTVVTKEPLNPSIKLVNRQIQCPRTYRELFYDYKQTTIPVSTTAIKIDDYVWVTFPGELFHEIGKRIKKSTHSKYSYLVGYCNGSVGYFPTQKAFSEGGYEVSASHFDPISEHVYVRGVEKLLIELFDQ
jgi:neutral ceramidase